MKEFSFILPEVDKADQGKEKLSSRTKGKTRELLTHNYAEIYKIPDSMKTCFMIHWPASPPGRVWTSGKSHERQRFRF